eukprot:3718952-Rhodomonas_salina.1
MEPARRQPALPQFQKQRHKILKHLAAHQHAHPAAEKVAHLPWFKARDPRTAKSIATKRILSTIWVE